LCHIFNPWPLYSKVKYRDTIFIPYRGHIIKWNLSFMSGKAFQKVKNLPYHLHFFSMILGKYPNLKKKYNSINSLCKVMLYVPKIGACLKCNWRALILGTTCFKGVSLQIMLQSSSTHPWFVLWIAMVISHNLWNQLEEKHYLEYIKYMVIYCDSYYRSTLVDSTHECSI